MKHAFGTLIFADGHEPFVIDRETGALSFGHQHELLPRKPVTWSDAKKAEITAQVRAACQREIRDVVLGAYHCHDCGSWVDATWETWSYGICLSCSLDRASEMAEHYADD